MMERLIELSDPYEAVWISTAYNRGELPPHHPMPAMQLWPVWITDDFTTELGIWNETKGCYDIIVR